MTFHKIAPFWKIVLALLVCMGAFFRFCNLDKKIYWGDEAATSQLISGYSTRAMTRELAFPRQQTAQNVMRFQSVHRDRGVSETVRALAMNDPQHPPLYYGLLRIWAGVFGDSVLALRAFSALLSLLLLPTIWFLCRELFYDQIHRAWLEAATVILVWLSPLHILYAQEARQYSLLAVVMVFSTACLLRAWRVNNRGGWVLYGLGVVLGIYTHTLFVLMWLAQIAIMAGFLKMAMKTPAADAPHETRRRLLGFVAATCVAATLFLPWAVLIWKGQSEVAHNMAWINYDASIRFLMSRWVSNFANLFFDVQHDSVDFEFWKAYPLAAIVVRQFRWIMVSFLFAACYSVWRFAPRRIALVLAVWVLVPFLVFAIPDLLLGGKRSTIARFILPCLLGLQVTIAYFLATKIHGWRQAASPATLLNASPAAAFAGRYLWSGVLAVLVGSMLVSNVVIARAPIWWSKYDPQNFTRAAEIVNVQKNSLLVLNLDIDSLAMCRLLASQKQLTFMVDEEVRYLDGSLFEVRPLENVAHTRTIFFYGLTPEQLSTLENQGARLVKIEKGTGLWRLQ